jgi:hypothetical protein
MRTLFLPVFSILQLCGYLGVIQARLDDGVKLELKIFKDRSVIIRLFIDMIYPNVPLYIKRYIDEVLSEYIESRGKRDFKTTPTFLINSDLLLSTFDLILHKFCKSLISLFDISRESRILSLTTYHACTHKRLRVIQQHAFVAFPRQPLSM